MKKSFIICLFVLMAGTASFASSFSGAYVISDIQVERMKTSVDKITHFYVHLADYIGGPTKKTIKMYNGSGLNGHQMQLAEMLEECFYGYGEIASFYSSYSSTNPYYVSSDTKWKLVINRY